jgi:hypothetical protein
LSLLQALHVAGVAIHDEAAQLAEQQAAAEAQAETAASGTAERQLSRKEEKRRRRAERASKLEKAAMTGQDGLAGELQARGFTTAGPCTSAILVPILGADLGRH